MKANRKKKSTEMEIIRSGKDEMNLAEFPLAITGNRVPEGVKTLKYQDRHGELTVTGSDALGLPTSIDSDVVVALIELTKTRNNFTEHTVNFTRYELIRMLGWANVGSSYERIEESLNRWAGVLLMYDGCWWDNRSKSYVSKTFHIIESILIAEGKTKVIKQGEQTTLPLSSFTWSKDFMQSCQDNNLKDLDTPLYFSLKFPTSKQLFRFLDKRFYRKPEVVFDLAEIAFERVGLSRSYKSNAGKIKEKLGDAIKELESKGFLKPLSREDRYFKTHEGWKIRFVDGRGITPALVESQPESTPPLTTELVSRGVHKDTADELVERYPADVIGIKLEVFDWMAEKKDKRIAKNPAGYLVKSIEKGYATPPGFTSKADREAKAEAARKRDKAEMDSRRQKQQEEIRERQQAARVEDFLKALTPEERTQVETEAILHANEVERRTLDSPDMKIVRPTLLLTMVREYVGQKLDAETQPVFQLSPHPAP